jgi:hypothetical protein
VHGGPDQRSLGQLGSYGGSYHRHLAVGTGRTVDAAT